MDASEHGAQADNTLPCFGISEVADMTGISAFTIRYYDKCGFFPELARDARGVRTFSRRRATSGWPSCGLRRRCSSTSEPSSTRA